VTVVVSLAGVTPPARYDEQAWTRARIQQAATETGSYTLLETIDLDPVASNPAHPPTYDLTTALATAGYWHRVVWVDDSGNLSEPTDPVHDLSGTTAYATRSELAAILKVNETNNAAALDRVLLAAAGEINSETGRTDLAGWELALAEQVNLARAEELWKQSKAPWGLIGVDTEFGATRIARDTWERHAHMLAPLKHSWGLA
jgi:hypothetical protein